MSNKLKSDIIKEWKNELISLSVFILKKFSLLYLYFIYYFKSIKYLLGGGGLNE